MTRGYLLFASLVIAPLAIANPTEESIKSWGYTVTKSLTYNAALCSTPQVLTRQLLGIKSLEPVKGEPNTYYRFTLGTESFATDEDKNKRIDQLQNPVARNSLESKSCSLIKFFSCNEKIYFVHTDSLLFETQLDSIKHLFYQQSCGDEFID